MPLGWKEKNPEWPPQKWIPRIFPSFNSLPFPSLSLSSSPFLSFPFPSLVGDSHGVGREIRFDLVYIGMLTNPQYGFVSESGDLEKGWCPFGSL